MAEGSKRKSCFFITKAPTALASAVYLHWNQEAVEQLKHSFWLNGSLCDASAKFGKNVACVLEKPLSCPKRSIQASFFKWVFNDTVNRTNDRPFFFSNFLC